jgi:hypothetical protein
MHSIEAGAERTRARSGAAVAAGDGARAAARCGECEEVPRWVLRLLRTARRDRLTGSLDLSLKDGVPSSVKRIIEYLEPSKIA